MGTIEHQGTVINTTADSVNVRITSYSACHNCDARHGCGLMECRDKTFAVPTADPSAFTPGENVIVSMETSLGFKAVFYSYILPLIFVILAIIATEAAGANELIAGISGIIILIPYYFWLFLNTKKFKQQFNFKISKL